ncbi:MAG: hypothetical protein A2827_03075 [Candidatus Spechtbacteria bacterium RIFCSPHIGHO2_01_FULL_43_30]|uniref:Inosine/uridine-preferring nucleoside hydrolase domain-containing protein n=1 Tax=Candidatus Spechtbacteria bacterium RIFCSPHIGHO2_01_FULL_43_30 TaxID=1802158 RepID=A0A1G2H4X3_9BACT|nr:MAG: hypothetical protein A2827_03075 [Candidatus Spechtbacteria bacterium RIFCSPHIGHO2_01_FULL_43_30]
MRELFCFFSYAYFTLFFLERSDSSAELGWRCTLYDNRCLVFVDNTDPDNLAAVLALANVKFRTELMGVVVTGRAANFNRDDPTDTVKIVDSAIALRINTSRMRNFLEKSGYSHVPVYMGTSSPHTLIPHDAHIDERDFDDLTPGQIKNAENLIPPSRMNSRGTIGDLTQILTKDRANIDVVVGGPMTDLFMLILMFPEFAQQIRSVHAQMGFFGFGETGLMEFDGKPRGKRQFNAACDPYAAHHVLMNLDAPVFLYPSDVTRVNGIGFSNPDELARFLEDTPATRELTRIYRIAYEKMVKPKGEKIFVHDFAPVLGYLQWLSHGCSYHKNGIFYRVKPIKVTQVPFRDEERDRWGEIDIEFMDEPSYDPKSRFVAVKVNEQAYLGEMRNLLK